MFEDTHHVHGFDDFQRGFGHGVELEQVVAAEGDDADLLVHGHMRGSLLAGRDRLAGEVEGVAVEVGHDLDLVGVLELLFGGEIGHEVHDVDGRVLEHGLDGGVDHVGGDHGFVALHHHHDVGALSGHFLNLEHGFCGTGRAAHVRVGGHHGLEPGGGGVVHHHLIAGGDPCGGEVFAHAGADGDVSDHRDAVDVGEGFAGEAAGAHAGGDDGDDIHENLLKKGVSLPCPPSGSRRAP